MKKTILSVVSLLVIASLIFFGFGCKTTEATETKIEEDAGSTEVSDTEETSGEVVTITFSVWGMPWEDLIYTDILIPMFEEQNPNIKVEFQRYDDYWNKLILLYAGGEAPDVMRNHLGHIGAQYTNEMLMPLDDFISGEDGIDMGQYVDGWYKGMPYADKVYAIPVGVNNQTVIAYNMDTYDAAGLEYPSHDWTLEDFEKDAQTLTSGDTSGFYWETNWATALSIFLATGAKIWEGDAKDKFVYDEGLVDGFELLQKYVWDDKITPIELGSGESRESSLQLFQSGMLGLLSMGGWQVPSITFNAPDLRFGVVPFPKTELKGTGGWAAGTNYTMNDQTEHPKEAWKLLKFMTSEEAILKYWQHTYVETTANMLVRENSEYENILGMEGNVLPITDPEEFERKLGFHLLIAENEWFHMSVAQSPYFNFLINPMSSALDQTVGVERGDAATAAKTMVDDINFAIEDSIY